MKLDIHVKKVHPYNYVERAAKGYCNQYGWYGNTRSLEIVDKCIPGIIPQKFSSIIRAPQEYSPTLSKINFKKWNLYALGA